MAEKNNTQGVLAFFFAFPTIVIHLRQLSRELKISMPAVLSAIRKLQKEKLVIVEKRKAFTNVRADLENPSFIHLKKVNNMELLYTCGLVVLLAKGLPQAIICFGSYSRGEDTEDSDIDIALVNSQKQDFSMEKFERLLNRSISIHHVNLDKVNNEFRSNLYNGFVLEGAI